MSEVNLEAVARARVDDPMNTWPDHIQRHRITLMGNFLWDHLCLRCQLERVATEQTKETAKSIRRAVDRVKEARRHAVMGGCCERFADNQACDCLEKARAEDAKR